MKKPILFVFFLSGIFAFAMPTVPWFSDIQKLEATNEFLEADDISIDSYLLTYSGGEGPWTLKASVGYLNYQTDFVPTIVGVPAKLEENTETFNVQLTREWNKAWSNSLSVGGYKGFSEYRSIWIAEQYRQDFLGFPNDYEAPDPSGRSVTATTIWNYAPGAGSATLALTYGRDVIAPGWSFDPIVFQAVAAADTLQTFSANIRVDHALNGWLKTAVDATTTQISERDPRFSISNTWAATYAQLGLRLNGGYTEETPGFSATFGSAILEWNFHPQWSVYTGYRVYVDSGEIQASGFNALAPEVNSTEFFTGIQWNRGDISASAGIGFLKTDYAKLDANNLFFGNLYQDRDWQTFRFAASYNF
jgi:hypothetical protein